MVLDTLTLHTHQRPSLDCCAGFCLHKLLKNYEFKDDHDDITDPQSNEASTLNKHSSNWTKEEIVDLIAIGDERQDSAGTLVMPLKQDGLSVVHQGDDFLWSS
ncbi:hypothetical protein Y1Q_0017794 [Alligator mississippiensis]|uniref:Uncharacterized protein n=1 Tax=Alligator mississippiensis TaxID=8496 RepID=A0A151MJK6_ALLMI|nr:hypothetical protein Y1Q_0017794 [Alligator mississippiensis]